MKVRDIIRTITDEGCVLVRHGRKHDWYRNVVTGAIDAIPRHREVKEGTAADIIKKLSLPKQEQ